MLITGILLITASLIMIYHLIKNVVKEEYPNGQKYKYLYESFSIAGLLFLIGIALVLQIILGQGPWW